MNVTIDNTIRTVNSFTVLLVFSWSPIIVNMLAARLSMISPSRMAMMILANNMVWLKMVCLKYAECVSVLHRRGLSI